MDGYEMDGRELRVKQFEAFYGCVLRSFDNCNDQPIYHYRLDVQWKMFTEAPYKGESEITRLDYCRSGPLFSKKCNSAWGKGYKYVI